MLRRGTTRLQRIVEDLLLVAQIEADRLELDHAPADLTELAAATVEAARPAAAEQGIDLSLDARTACRSKPTPGGSGRCSTTSSRTRSSSRPSGGSVTLSAHNGDGGLHVEVADNGIGIPRDEIGQLFSRFYRASTATRRAIPGTGLGLVIARAIVEAHSGTISLESREGEGTRVTVDAAVRQVRPLAAHVAVAEAAHRLDRLEAVGDVAELLTQIET